jgi:hypothetical protein
MFVLNIRPWWRSKRINVWSEIFWLDSTTFSRAKKRLKDSSVEREEGGGVILWGWGLDDKVEIAPTGEEG